MKVPISWLEDYVEIDLSIEELAHRLTMAGLEVEEIRYVGLPMPETSGEWTSGHLRREAKISGLAWDPEKMVVGAVLEVMPHPNADRLVLCRVDDGQQVHTVLTGAPNLFPYVDQGPLKDPIKVAYAREGARLYDGHQPGWEPMTLERARIRGVESYSMVCSEKELGISEEHEGVIFLDDDAPVGTPLVEYMGDAVLDIAITPNMARNANILGVAREVAALTGRPLSPPSPEVVAEGAPIDGKVLIVIEEPEFNPRFVVGLIQDVEARESPYWVQRRLRLAGMRPINALVDATNYAMLEIGEPLHAFDYDVLRERAGGEKVTIITRTAEAGEHLTTLDDVNRTLKPFTVLVCDSAGPLSIAGVIGGAESEVGPGTKNVLLEGAAWNFINVRRTMTDQRIQSEAGYRFSRGVHPAQASRGVRRGLELMRQWAGGTVAQGLVDAYPLPPEDPTVVVTPADTRRWLGIELSTEEMAEVLRALDFHVKVVNGRVQATTPDHRLDIGEGLVGKADLMEEIARVYGYDRIPETRLSDTLPPQRGNAELDREEQVRDILVGMGLQEVITYRMTSPENEARRLPPVSRPDDRAYVQLANPISSERDVLRHSVLASVLEVVERNARFRERHALFEIGPIFLASEEGPLPDERSQLVIVLSGPREPNAWQGADRQPMDFYDLKGIVHQLLEGVHLDDLTYEHGSHPSFHPGRCARVSRQGKQIGVIGELHPLVREGYELAERPVLAGILDMDLLLKAIPESYLVEEIPTYPPVLEDLAIVVDEGVTAAQVEEVIRQAGGRMVVRVVLFDLYRGDQIGPGKKSLAYRLTYLDPDRTLTDGEVAKIRERIVGQLERKLNARLRS